MRVARDGGQTVPETFGTEGVEKYNDSFADER